MIDIISGMDADILLFIQNFVRTPLLTGIFGFFSIICNKGFIWLLLSVALIIFKNTRVLGFRLLICVAVCWVISDVVLKNLLERARPFDSVDGLNVALLRFTDVNSYSFPSGHATSSFAAAYCICRYVKRWGGLIYIPASIIALSRVYIGVHYPSDVLTGAIIGTLGAAAVCVIIDYRIRSKSKTS